MEPIIESKNNENNDKLSQKKVSQKKVSHTKVSKKKVSKIKIIQNKINTLHKLYENYKNKYNDISLFLKDIDKKYINIKNIINKPYKYSENIEKKLKCLKCLNYYKLNQNEPLLNIHKLLLSVKLSFSVDYMNNNFNNIVIFLPLLDNFCNDDTNKDNSSKYFENLYYKLIETKNITFKDIDNLLLILIYIINIVIEEDNDNDNDKTKLNIITFINNSLQIFKEINKHIATTDTFDIFLKKLKINQFIFDKLINLFHIDKYLKFQDIKLKINNFLGTEIISQLTLLIKDYDYIMKNDTSTINIQLYLKKKINNFLLEFNFIDFGIIPELFNLNSTTLSSTSKSRHTSPSRHITSRPTPSIRLNSYSTVGGGGFFSKLFTKNKYQKLNSHNIMKDLFNINNDIKWSNFKYNLDDNDETLFDVINNNNNDYIILNNILSSLSISSNFSNDSNINKIIDYYNNFIYKSLYGKTCFKVDKLQNNTHQRTAFLPEEYKNTRKSRISKLFSKTKSFKPSTKHIKPYTSKQTNIDTSSKIFFSVEKDIGLNDICTGLNEELTVSSKSLEKFDVFFGKLFNLTLNSTTLFKDTIKKQILLLFLNYIIKNNIDNYVKLQIDNAISIDISKNNNILMKQINYDRDRDLQHNEDDEEFKIMFKFIKDTFKDKDNKIIKNYFLFYYHKFKSIIKYLVENEHNSKLDDTKKFIILKFNKDLLPEHKINESIFLEFFKYNIPISSKIIEDFINFKILNGNDGFNYIKYYCNDSYINAYVDSQMHR